MNVNAALKETSRSVVGSRSCSSKALLVVQVAISLVLLVGAGLFLRTLQNLRQVDVGFNPQNLLLFRVNPPLNRYDEKRDRDALPRDARAARAVPGVRGRRAVAAGAAVGQRQPHQHLRPGPRPTRPSRDRDNSINASSSRRTSST